MKNTNANAAAFRSVFSSPATLRALLGGRLGQDVVDEFDFDHVEVTDDSFVEPRDRGAFSDVVIAVKLRGGRDAAIYLLVDHFRSDDGGPHIQMLRGQVELWTADSKAGRQLRPVVPVLLRY